MGGRRLCRGIVACARDGVTEGLIGLVDQLCPGFRLAVQCWRMIETIRMPDLDLFMPGFLNIGKRGGRPKFEHCVMVGRPFVPHLFFPLSATECSGVEEGGLAGCGKK